MINKKLIIVLIIIFLSVVIIFIGYYPPFFPFLKYGPFSKPITKEVFSIDNFPYDPDDAPQFFVEVTKIVREKWYDDARLAWVDAVLLPDGTVSYTAIWGLVFYSDSHPMRLRYSEKGEVISELRVFYNAEVYIESYPIRFLSGILPKSFMRSSLGQKFGYSKYNLSVKIKNHEYNSANNKKLIARVCVDNFACQYENHNLPGSINPEDIKISPKQAYEMVTDSIMEIPEISTSIILLNQKDELWFKEREIDPNFPLFWRISNFKINATTGEVFEF